VSGENHVCSERKNIEKMLSRVMDLEKSKERNEVLIETFIETTKDLSSTMKQVEKTMIKMQNSIENSENKISLLSGKVDELKKNEELGKIDVRKVLKEHFGKITLGGFGAYGVYDLVKYLIEKQGG
jgi:translation initiation factor 2B subunit (eIF-2B alpha/beta/delta family)